MSQGKQGLEVETLKLDLYGRDSGVILSSCRPQVSLVRNIKMFTLGNGRFKFMHSLREGNHRADYSARILGSSPDSHGSCFYSQAVFFLVISSFIPPKKA